MHKVGGLERAAAREVSGSQGGLRGREEMQILWRVCEQVLPAERDAGHSKRLKAIYSDSMQRGSTLPAVTTETTI